MKVTNAMQLVSVVTVDTKCLAVESKSNSSILHCRKTVWANDDAWEIPLGRRKFVKGAGQAGCQLKNRAVGFGGKLGNWTGMYKYCLYVGGRENFPSTDGLSQISKTPPSLLTERLAHNLEAHTQVDPFHMVKQKTENRDLNKTQAI
jgi:hypothetical protein